MFLNNWQNGFVGDVPGSASVVAVRVLIVVVVVVLPDVFVCLFYFVSSVEKTFGTETQADNAHSFCKRR